MTFYHLHAHSHFSALDGLPNVRDMVRQVTEMGQPALALTDHGSMAGAVQLYKECSKAGIQPFPGIEAYLADPTAANPLAPETQRYHVTLLPVTTKGYQALVKLTSVSHTRPRFHRYPRITMADLTGLGADTDGDVVLLTGCFFGWPVQTLTQTQSEPETRQAVEQFAAVLPTYVELQHHDMRDDEGERNGMDDTEIVEAMIRVADRLGLPVVVTQDSHYLDPQDTLAHSFMKKIVYGSVEDSFPGDSYHLSSEAWVRRHYTRKQWARAMDGMDDLLARHRLTIPPLDVFQPHVPSMTPRPDAVLSGMVQSSLWSLQPRKIKVYEDRLAQELKVIRTLGMADYFLLVADYVKWCESKNICVEARGSANGSLVCYLLGITQVDPIKWGLLFERFLSIDRIKPPDIDIDVEDVNRDRLIRHLQHRFATTKIGTWSSLGVNDEGKGSVLVTYRTWLAGQREAQVKPRPDGKPDHDARKSARTRAYASAQTVEAVRRFSQDDADGIEALGQYQARRSVGVHPGGLLLSGDGMKAEDWVPTMLVASSDTTVTQYDMDDVEEFGLLKLDVLGQATLTVMRRCQELAKVPNPVNFTWIPEDDPQACRLLREGRVDTGIFHFEAPTKSRGGREIGVRRTKDVVLVQALYMPGAMDSGQARLYIARRNDADLRSQVTYPHPAFEKALSGTYGTLIYQEQVIAIMRNIGMSLATINMMFKLVKDSGAGSLSRNKDRLATIEREFTDRCKAEGMTKQVARECWAQVSGMASYAFNQAHATAYGIRSYRSAYLKAHYPLEFMCALLEAWTGTQKEVLYVREARRIGIRVLPAHVNHSGPTWVMDQKRNTLRRPLGSIKGIGGAAVDEIVHGAPFQSIEDLVDRTTSRAVTGGATYKKSGEFIGVLRILNEAGALNGLV